MATLTNILAIAKMTKNDFNYLKRSELLKTKYPTVPAGGIARLSRKNAMELIFLGALHGVGLSWDESAARTKEWLAAADAGAFAPFFAVNPFTGMNFQFADSQISFAKLANQMPDRKNAKASGWGDDEPVATDDQHPATSIAIINRRELLRRIDALFAEKA